ncbi:MAG: hypothetical protein A2297_06815 [Elusimicrobia bacterium RIFOXYB2_FULL_48_7]|nr:MAG: hypothetical protein A2297_06815 [Elusimicrobia bacterium RIFOXYB2_FULL_48_7]
MNKIVFFLIAAILILSGSLRADEGNKGKIAVGFIYPGISAKYYFTDKFGLELHNGLGNNVFLMGARGLYNFKQIDKITFYAGLEGDYITFNRKYIQQGLGQTIKAVNSNVRNKPLAFCVNMGQ